MRYVDPLVEDAAASGLADWLNRELSTTTVATIRTGFMTARAIHAVHDALEQLLERGGLLRVVVGGELLQCDVDALRVLLELQRRFLKLVTVLVVVDEQGLQNAKTYHLSHAEGRESAWVGSANLTTGGVASNLEASVVLDSTDDPQAELTRILEATLTLIAEGKGTFLGEDLVQSLDRRVRVADPYRRPVDLGPTATFGDHARAVVERLERSSELGRDEQALPTGFSDLDTLFHGGLRPGTLTVVGSRPTVGRSTLGLNIATHAVLDHRVPTCLFSFESGEDEILLRIISGVAGVDHANLHTARLGEDDWVRVAEAAGRLQEAPLLLNSSPAPRLDHLLGVMDDAAVQHGLGLIVVDRIDLVGLPATGYDRSDNVGEVARALKTLALRRRLRVVVTAEIDASELADLPPVPTQLRGSDTLFGVADVVLLMHRPLHPLEPGSGVDADVIVAKNRYGKRGYAPLTFHGGQARFLNHEYRPPMT